MASPRMRAASCGAWKPFEFSEIQANHILDMPLRRLAQLEQQKLKDEHEELLAIIIDKQVVDPDDVEMLQDLVKAAINEAARKVDEEMQSSMGAMTGGMKIPGF